MGRISIKFQTYMKHRLPSITILWFFEGSGRTLSHCSTVSQGFIRSSLSDNYGNCTFTLLIYMEYIEILQVISNVNINNGYWVCYYKENNALKFKHCSLTITIATLIKLTSKSRHYRENFITGWLLSLLPLKTK